MCESSKGAEAATWKGTIGQYPLSLTFQASRRFEIKKTDIIATEIPIRKQIWFDSSINLGSMAYSQAMRWIMSPIAPHILMLNCMSKHPFAIYSDYQFMLFVINRVYVSLAGVKTQKACYSRSWRLYACATIQSLSLSLWCWIRVK